MNTVTAAEGISLELDDIQSGALHERPSPYVGTYLLLRIDDRAAGRELVRRLHPVVDSGRPSSDPAHDAWITVAFTYQGLKALGVPQDSLDSFAPEFRQGMAARAAELGDVGESSPANWEKPLGTPDVHVALAALSPDAARLEAVVEKARRAHQELPGVEVIWRQDCYQLPTGRTSFGFKDGIGQPAVEGSGMPTLEPEGEAAQGGRVHPRLPGRDGRAAADADSGGARPKRHLRRLSQAAHEGGGVPAVPAREGREPRGGGAARREDGRALAERRAARALPRAGRSRARRRPAPQQRLPLRRRSARLQVPGRRARAAGEPARRARRRGQRRRPPAPHDPARHELRPDAARGRARGRRRRPGHHLRLRRRAPQAPVRVRQDPVAERRHLHRRPGSRRTRSSGRTTARAPSPSRSGRSGAGCRTCRRSSSPAAASTASPRACARCAGSRSWRRDQTRSRRGRRRGNEPDKHRPLEGARLRPAAVRSGRARLTGARRVRLRRARRRHHPQPAARRQRDHDGDGRPPDRDPGDDRGPPRRPRRHPHRRRRAEPSPSAATCASART